MMKTLNLLNEILPWIALVVLFIAEKVASYYEYTKKNDPEMAKKLQHVGELAKWAVADQSRFGDKAGVDKFSDAVKAVQKQIGDKAITEQTIKGAVQDAYKKEAEKAAEPATVVTAEPAQPKPEPVLDDLEVHDLSGGENG